ncbi:MAG: cob(I)yrinic acid a,c-diamide adenosyltransferase [Haliscomenobacter sp.]|nr:cob(I)yrinic acid a,c-diamide adenosyltransferase [Haliscomenobacter sp.]MBK7474511.1 cob(I)yrinic acid a,c-diamide adenosyltransferase [Haliscomenobacter sp.]MBK8880618.1 cob(I)yrinic acid a,c-diamide adenosyltransferase [Haliscomenobacter sp.]
MAFRIYTKTGDAGETSLFGGRRLPKDHLRIEAYGTVDELNSFLGLVSDGLEEETNRVLVRQIQSRLFDLGASLASDPEKFTPSPSLRESDIASLEEAIDRMDAILPPLKNFILPGGHFAVSYCHLARCVCRRAERLVVALARTEPVDEIVVKYLNRLSDFLFVLARYQGHVLGIPEVLWQGRTD